MIADESARSKNFQRPLSRFDGWLGRYSEAAFFSDERRSSASQDEGVGHSYGDARDRPRFFRPPQLAAMGSFEMHLEQGGSEMAKGDLISVRCLWGWIPYRHYGIDVGDGDVVHLATCASSKEMRVQLVSWDEFAQSQSVRVETVVGSESPDAVVDRARAAVGHQGYHLALGNCEHFARYCKTGKGSSYQVERVIRSALRVSVGAAAGGASRMALRRAAGVPSIVGETARQTAYAVSRVCSMEHTQADRMGRSIGVLAAGVTGVIAGGPAGGIASAALYLSIDRVADQAFQRWETLATPAAGSARYRKSSDSNVASREY